MDTKELASFLAFVKYGSFNRAAREMNYSVSSMTRHIRNLEEELGTELVESRGRNASLTENGRRFIPYAERIMDTYRRAEAELSGRGAPRSFSLYVSETVGLHRLTVLEDLFAREFPEVELTVSPGPYGSIVDKLTDGTVDMAVYQDFSPIDEPRGTSKVLFPEPLGLVCAPEHPLAGRKSVAPSDIDGRELIIPRREYLGQPVIAEIAAENEKGRIFLDSGMLVIRAVKKQNGVAFVPLSTAEDELAAGTLERLPCAGDPFRMNVYSVYMTGSPKMRVISALAAMLRSAAHS